MGNLTNLQTLHLYDNQLSGELPAELGNLTNLRELHLYENELSGALPESLGNLTSLRDLILDENDFSGGLPSSLGNLTNLELLYLDRTQLSGNTLTAGQSFTLQATVRNQGNWAIRCNDFALLSLVRRDHLYNRYGSRHGCGERPCRFRHQ